MRTLKLMADYGCFPLWEADPGKVGNVDPESLPISATLKADLAKWAAIFDGTLNPDDPLNSGFQDDTAEQRFKKSGLFLAKRLQDELGGDYLVRTKI